MTEHFPPGPDEVAEEIEAREHPAVDVESDPLQQEGNVDASEDDDGAPVPV